jgi:hypothetical protein
LKFFVSRQIYWGVEDPNTVEIAIGGCDYSNPDMLVGKYPGEGQEYTNPVEAAEIAFAIAAAWKKDCPKLKINIAHGNTMGMTRPFEGSTKKAIRAWANKLLETLPKCDECGEMIIDEDNYYKYDDFPDMKFCREYCAEEFARKNLVTEES